MTENIESLLYDLKQATILALNSCSPDQVYECILDSLEYHCSSQKNKIEIESSNLEKSQNLLNMLKTNLDPAGNVVFNLSCSSSDQSKICKKAFDDFWASF